MKQRPPTVAEFRARIAGILRDPGAPPTYRNSAPKWLLRDPKNPINQRPKRK